MSLSYGWQKFHAAIHVLTGSQPIRTRVTNAIASSLYGLKDEDLPKEMVTGFRTFINAMTSVPAKGEEGTIAATVDSLSELDLEEVISKIISMHDTVCRAYGPN